MMGMSAIALLAPPVEIPLLERPEVLIPLSIAVVSIVVLFSMWISKLPSAFRSRKGGVLDPMQLETLMPGVKPIIIDLRPHEEFRGKHGHIRNAMSVPPSELMERLEEIRKESKGKPVVLVDETDALSHQIKPFMEANGFTWLYVLKGGLRAWRAGKLPIYTADN